MKNRSPVAVFLLSLITLSFYLWYWFVKTKGEMNRTANTEIMTAWVWLIPIAGWIWWLWVYSKGVEKLTGGKFNGALAFVILYLLPFGIGPAIVQSEFNSAQTANAPVPEAPTPEATA